MVVEAAARHDVRGRRAQEPVEDVDLVRPEVDDRAAAEPLVPAPVPELLHGLEAVLLQPVRRDRVALRPAEVRRHRAVPLAVHGHDPPEELRLPEQLLVAVQVARVAAPLVPDLEELPRLPGREHHAPGALQGVRHLLLAVDVLAGLQAVDGVRGVPEVGRRDDDRVEVLLLVEHLPVVFVPVDLELELLEGVHDPLLVVLRPDVAHRPEAQAGDPEHGVEQHLPLGPRAEEGDVDLGDVLRGRGRLGARGLLRLLLVLVLLSPGVAEEAQGRHGREAQQHVAPVELLPGGLRARRACRERPPGPSRLPQPSLLSYFAGRPKTSTST